VSLRSKRFVNPWPGSVEHGLRDFLRWTAERRRHPPPPDPDPSLFPRVAPAFAQPRAPDDALTATWVGHSSVLLQIGTLNVLTDPIWSERASPVRFAGPRRWVPPGIALAALPPIDLVLISHNHYDHLDLATVRDLVARFPAARWLAPSGVAAWLKARGAGNTTEHGWWDTVDANGYTAACVPARHFSARTLWDRNRTLWCGWVIRAGTRGVYFAGDTGYHPDFAEVARRHGPFDLVALPIGAYEPRWFMQQVHMNPDEALRAYQELSDARLRDDGDAPVMLPIHWGTFKLTDEPMDEPPRRLRDGWRAGGLPSADLWLLAHGETRRC
jgi:N-acyl-phosphatidylethanolamine-hydrolysing phospholipase D